MIEYRISANIACDDPNCDSGTYHRDINPHCRRKKHDYANNLMHFADNMRREGWKISDDYRYAVCPDCVKRNSAIQ